MLSQRWIWGVAGLAIAVAFFAGRLSAQAPDEKVFELRTYVCNEGKLGDLNARFRNHTNQLFKKHGMELVGYWTPTEKPDSENTLIYILAHKSRDAAKKSWAAFGADPEWQDVRKKTEANGALVKKVTSVYMKATDYSPIK